MVMYNLEFLEKKQEYGSVYTFSFKSEEKIEFIAGQWTHLGFPSEERDKTRVHHMSFASSPHDELIQFSMNIGSGSWFKNAMAALQKGDSVKAFKINGDFTIQPDVDKEIIFIAGGIGITPIRSILRDETQRHTNLNWKLLHVSRDSYLYQTELQEMNHEQWRTNHAGVEGIWKNIILNSSNRIYYISGSDRFVLAMKEKLEQDGIQHIVTENFTK